MRIRVQGIPYRDDVSYYRLGYEIPCGEPVELEVDAATYEALASDAWLRVEVVSESWSHGEPPMDGTAHSGAADAVGGDTASASLETPADGTPEPTHRAVRQRGRNRR